MRLPLPFLSLFLVPFAACGGSGSSTGSAGPTTTGSTYVVVDTATGSDALVQFQLAGAVLQRGDGTATGNLLAAPEMVTLADPSGELDGVTLRNVPTGEYASLRLVLVPGSGAALCADGAVVPVNGPTELTVPLAEALQHDATGVSWLALGHNGSAPPARPASGSASWSPTLRGRVAGAPQQIAGLRIAAVQSPTVTTMLRAADDGPLQIEFAPDCVFFDDHGGSVGSRDDFLRGISSGDHLSVDADLHRDGRCRARSARRHGQGNDGPRLLGRIGELRPATASFVLEVQAEVRRGDRRLLPTPVQVLVRAGAARIHQSHTHRVLQFAELQTGQLAKLEWTSRTPVAGGLEEVVAREIEVTSGAGVPMQPEWEGAVQSIDQVAGVIVVVPRGNDPIFVQGQGVSRVDVRVGSSTRIERRANSGGGRTTITLGEIVPGQDRIWWSGVVTGPASMDATWVRVRDD